MRLVLLAVTLLIATACSKDKEAPSPPPSKPPVPALDAAPKVATAVDAAPTTADASPVATTIDAAPKVAATVDAAPRVATTVDAAPRIAAPDAAPPPAASKCDQMTRAECLASSKCTLHWVKQSLYECKADNGPCEVGIRQSDRKACEAVGSCSWDGGSCYCPFPGYGKTAVPDDKGPSDGAGACGCGGGQPAMCVPSQTQ